jgi:fibro-slime domain-containing protein
MRIALAVLALAGFSACGGGDDDDGSLPGGGGKGAIGVSGNTGIPVGSGGSNGNAGGSNGSGGSVYMLPADFTPADSGGWKLGEEITDGSVPGSGGSSSDGCGAEIIGIVRDFRAGDEDGGHPDFETFTGTGEEGIVEDQLGDDQKPVYVDEEHRYTTTKQNFDQWYVNDDDVNRAYLISFYLEPASSGGVLTFHSSDFFPLDGEGFGDQDNDHNFHFTTEVHTTFRYNGGETFQFTGDDDLWVFINGRLAIDLGGLHSELSERISLDEEAARLGITKGSVYPLDLFHAERHTHESNFRIDTNLYFVDCGIIVPEPVR